MAVNVILLSVALVLLVESVKAMDEDEPIIASPDCLLEAVSRWRMEQPILSPVTAVPSNGTFTDELPSGYLTFEPSCSRKSSISVELTSTQAPELKTSRTVHLCYKAFVGMKSLHNQCFSLNTSWAISVKRLICWTDVRTWNSLMLHVQVSIPYGQQSSHYYGELYAPTLDHNRLCSPQCSGDVDLKPIKHIICRNPFVIKHSPTVKMKEISLRVAGNDGIESVPLLESQVNVTLTVITPNCSCNGRASLQVLYENLGSLCHLSVGVRLHFYVKRRTSCFNVSRPSRSFPEVTSSSSENAKETNEQIVVKCVAISFLVALVVSVVVFIITRTGSAKLCPQSTCSRRGHLQSGNAVLNNNSSEEQQPLENLHLNSDTDIDHTQLFDRNDFKTSV